MVNIKQCLLVPSPNLGIIQKQVTRGELSSILNLMIIDLVEFFSVTNTMGKSQVEQTVDLIIDSPEYQELKLEDLKLCFNYTKRGWFGTVFNRIDGGVIFECLNKYIELRREQKANAFKAKHEETKKLEAATPRKGDASAGLALLRQFRDELIARDKADKKRIMEKVNFNRDQQKFDNKLFRQFDILFEKYAIDTNRGKFIKRYGKILSLNEFMKHKYEQLAIIKTRKK